MALKDAIQAAFPEIEVELNPKQPRRNSFECLLIKENGKDVILWSGISKGPPRKLKFPEVSQVVDDLSSSL